MIGRTVSHYRIIEKLGEGGMGVVYKAEDTRLKRTVALKFLAPEFTRDESARNRFVHEAQAASALQHNNICTIHEIDETSDGRMFICMDCYEGETLKQKIARGPLPVNEAVDIAAQVAEGLAEAHKAGMTHRDIKPANIVVTRNGVARILDFGLAKLTGMTRVTRTGTTVGTVAYMSPEQARGDEVDARADIWSLGVVFYEMLTGETPFAGPHEAAVLYSIQHTQAAAVSEFRDDVPPELDSIVADAMAKDPSRRADNAGELARRLRTLGEGSDSGRRTVAPGARRTTPRRRGVIAAVFVVVVALGGFAWNALRTPEAHAIRSLVVLPLDNLTGDPEQDFFVDGMTEILTAQVARGSSFKVISRTSAMRYRDTEKSLPEIASELGVDAVIEGSVFRSEDSVRVTVQLIDARSDSHIWAATYDRLLRNVLAMQSEIAQTIFREVHSSITPGGEPTRVDATEINPIALDSYLRGRYLLNRRTRHGDIGKSVAYLEKTIELEPEYAPAYTALALTYSLLVSHGSLDAREAIPKATSLAQRALELDAGQAEAVAILGDAAYTYDWNWTESERLYQRAIAIDPNNAGAHVGYGEMLRCLGRFEEALSEITIGQELDPVAPMISAIKGWTLVIARRYEDAIAQCKRTLEMDEDFYLPYLIIKDAYYGMGDYDTGVEWEMEYMRVTGTSEEKIAEHRAMYEALGYDGMLRAGLDDALQKAEETGEWPWLWIAGGHVSLGETDAALEALEKALDKPSYFLTPIAVLETWDPVRGDPRFEKILERMNLKDYVLQTR